MKRVYRTPSVVGGFSLLEVLIAVVVLATGLLALAALQASLTRSSADTKVRSRVSAMLTARLDELRGVGYDNAALNPATTTFNCVGGVPAWLCTARDQANLGALTVVQTTTLFSSEVGANTFTAGRAPVAGEGEPEFKRVVLSATWTDSGNESHRLAMTSEFSPLALRDLLIPAPPPGTSGSGGPVVRTENPAGPGVIPIATGGGDATAASNPRPELVGRNNNESLVGTRFDVLSYSPANSDEVIIQKRFENSLIKCNCKYGAGGTNLPVIYRTSEWPAVWTGERYDVYEPDAPTAAPGQGLNSGPKPNIDQSALCTECCRDHHDTMTAGVAKFDPVRVVVDAQAHEHYNPNGAGVLVKVPDTASSDYIESCRLIRVDGFWRTAADMYSQQFGLLETEVVSNVLAKTGLPTTSATDAYTTFVKDYLEQYTGQVATAPANAETMFNEVARGLNTPDLVPIAAPSTTDFRYLHGRGLYVDYLEEDARDLLVDILADTGAQGRCPTGSDVADCILPFLPFTTINLTEIAKWTASDSTVLTVNSGNLLATIPSQPSGSRTVGIKVGTSDNTGEIRRSSSGVAVSTTLLSGVDPDDVAAVGTDVQPFEVGGTPNTGTGDLFTVRITGGGVNPFVFYAINTDSGECLKPASGDHRCTTNSTLPLPGSIRIEGYWVETTTSRSISATCTNPQGNLVSATDTIPVPTFRNYEVVSATIGATSGSIGSPVADNKRVETTTITFGSIAANDLVVITLAEQAGSPTYATVNTCTTNGAGNQINNPTWNKPWDQP